MLECRALALSVMCACSSDGCVSIVRGRSEQLFAYQEHVRRCDSSWLPADDLALHLHK